MTFLSRISLKKRQNIPKRYKMSSRSPLKQELRLATELFAHASDAVVITDRDNRIVMVNESFTRLTGYTIDEVRAQDPKYFSAGWGDHEFYKQMWAKIIGEGMWQGEVLDRKKTGELYTAELTILNIRDEKGETTHYIGISKDITETKQQQKQIEQLAHYDSLTLLPNRVLFRARVDAFIENASASGQRAALLFFDVDDFKWLNDSLGHKTGNDALVVITHRIQKLLGDDALLCRIGGDEFALWVPYRNPSDVTRLARSILECNAQPIRLGNKHVTLGLSIGISLFPQNGSDFGSLVQAADTAMNKAKSSGKNRFLFFDGRMSEQALRRLDVDTRLRQATANGSLSMVYQPKVSLQSREVYGLEALLRWNDPELGTVPPDEFIPIAEESHAIEAIGYWVLQRSLEEFANILAASRRELVLSINVSGRQLGDDTFVEHSAGIIRRSGVPPRLIEFEITETAIIQNIDTIALRLGALQRLGIAISIDDFGTGYSSMAYLKKLPIQTLKIDRAFIRDIHIDRDDRAIVEAIVAMCSQLGLSTIAEGVESDAHESMLKNIGVNDAQGYLYSKPLELEPCIRYIGRQQLFWEEQVG